MDQLVFTPYVIPSLVALNVIAGFILYVYSKNPYSLLNKLFVLFLVFVGIWMASEIVNTMTTSQNVVEYSLRAGAIGWNFLGPTFLLFVLTFVRQDRFVNNFFLLFFLACVSLATLFLIWRSDHIVTYYLERLSWGWQSPPGRYFPLFGLWVGFLFIFSFYRVMRFYLKAKIKEERRQAVLIFLSVLPAFIFGMVGLVVWPLVFGTHSPLLEAIIFPFTSLFFVFFLGIAIVKYRLFIISPSLVIPSIIDTMAEALIVLNSSLYIDFVNKTARNLLGYEEEELIGRKADRIVVGGEVWRAFLRRAVTPLREGKEVRNLELKFFTREGREVSVNFSASPVKNPDGEVTAMVCLAYDIGETKKLIRSLEQKLTQLRDAKINLERALGEKL